MPKFKTREEWLNAMTKALRPKFKTAGYPLPAKIHVSCAWPSERALSRKGSNRRIGECWASTASTSGHVEIFISPTESDSVKVGGILVHELVHAQDHDAGHGARFKGAMVPLGLIGKATATGESAELKRELAGLVKTLGTYPHGSIKIGAYKAKVQSTRLLKIECPECGYVARVTAKWIDVGYPTCPCGREMGSV